MRELVEESSMKIYGKSSSMGEQKSGKGTQ